MNALLGNLRTHKGTNVQTATEKQAINPLTFHFQHNSVFIFGPLLQRIDHTVRFVFTDTPLSEILVMGIVNFSWYWYHYRACLMIRVFVSSTIDTTILYYLVERRYDKFLTELVLFVLLNWTYLFIWSIVFIWKGIPGPFNITYN